MEKKLLKLLSETVSQERIQEHALEMHRLEGNCSYTRYKASTDYVMQCMKEAGFSRVERKTLAADGKTAHFDCIMPQAWEMDGKALLRLEDPTLSMEERILADNEKDPFTAGVWGAPTKKGGVKCQIVDIESIPAGKDSLMKGKLVLMDGIRAQYRRISDAGALGVIISDSKAGEEYPDYCRWSNGIGFTGWYHTAEDRRMVIFDITPRKAAFLRKRLKDKGPLEAFALSESRICDGEIYTVSGIIPGKSKEEITFFAHMYEPFVPDDAAGGMVAIEMCRALKQLIEEGKLPPLQKTLKVVLSMECYGFYEYFENAEQRKRTLSVFSFDSCCHVPVPGEPRVKLRHSTFLAPFFADRLFIKIFQENTPLYHYMEEKGNLSDDTFSASEEWAVPSLWPPTSCAKYHHNAGPSVMDADFTLAYDVARFMGVLTGILALTEKEKVHKLVKRIKKLEKEALKQKIDRILADLYEGKLSLYDAPEKICFHGNLAEEKLMSFNRFWKGSVAKEDCEVFHEIAQEAIESLPVPEKEQRLFGAEKEASRFVVKRLREGILMSLAAIPQKERKGKSIPDMVYMSLDGKRTLREAVKMWEFDRDCTTPEETYSRYMDELRYLEKYGYVKITLKKK